MTRAAAVLAVLATPLVAVLLWATPAQAHAYVVSTDPANGSQLQTAPSAVRVTFDEPVTLPSAADAASAIDEDGRRVDTGQARLEPGRRTLVIGLRGGLPHGVYIVSWSVVSADTHPIGGSIEFGYGVPATAVSTPAAGSAPSTGWELAVAAAKALVYLGLIAALGLVPAALVLGADEHERRILWRSARIGAAVVAAGSVAQAVVQYLWQASATRGGASWTGLGTFAEASYAAAVWARLALLGAAVLVLPPWRRPAHRRIRWTVAGLLALATLGSVVRNGHGGSGAWWQFASTLLHVTAMTAWLGGLAALGWLLLRRRITGERLRRLPLWSVYAAVSVAVLLTSGLLQSVVEVRFPGALTTTTYGFVLAAKVLLVVVAVALGFTGYRWIRRQIALAGSSDTDARPAPGQTARLRGRVRLEAAAGAAVVVVSGVLSSITPAEAAYAPQLQLRTAIGPYAVSIAVAPLRRGPESFRITVAGHTDATPPAESLQLVLSQPDGPVRALEVRFPYRIPGAIQPGAPTPMTFSSTTVNVPSAGTWTATLTVVAGRTRQYTDAFDFRVY
ncbi:copper resistance protein CopC [Dactylosporangium sp. NPDC051484]|uniref:copper resistance CopC/CopD family protein n=1 Tax=Dactylosporangium sp. NPDC051484 TaxID=3154942 RepID=UPI00344BFDF8